METSALQRQAAIDLGLRVHKVTARIGKTELARKIGGDVTRSTILLITGGRGYEVSKEVLLRAVNICSEHLHEKDVEYMRILVERVHSFTSSVLSPKAVKDRFPINIS